MTVVRATLAGLLTLSAWLLVAPPVGPGTAPLPRLLTGLLCAMPLLLLVVAGLRGVRQWGAWVAIVLVPYFALSVGSLMLALDRRVESGAFATLVAAVFFAGIAASRQVR